MIHFPRDITMVLPLQPGWYGGASAGSLAKYVGLDPWEDEYEVMTLVEPWAEFPARSAVVVGPQGVTIIPPKMLAKIH